MALLETEIELLPVVMGREDWDEVVEALLYISERRSGGNHRFIADSIKDLGVTTRNG